MAHFPSHSRIYNIKYDSLDASYNSKETTKSKVVKKKLPVLITAVENKNSLTSLLSCYDSDSDHEETKYETKKLNAKVQDFLSEVNMISANKTTKKGIKKQTEKECAWQECIDNSSGYPYYWNTNTNEVTWEMPEEYKHSEQNSLILENQTAIKKTHEKESICLKKTSPEKENTKKNVTGLVKKYENHKQHSSSRKHKQITSEQINQKKRRKSSDSDDEKIVMITSYSNASGSDSDNEQKLKKNKKEYLIDEQISTQITESKIDLNSSTSEQTSMNGMPVKKEVIELIKKQSVDETVILSRLRTQAKVLHELSNDKTNLASLPVTSKPDSLALVAVYGDDSDGEEESAKTPLFPIMLNERSDAINEQNQVVTFPALKSAVQQENICLKENNEDSLVDNKLYKRKRRLEFEYNLSRNSKREKDNEFYGDSDLNFEERKGFGFSESTSSDQDNKKFDKAAYKNGINFIKAETLNPSTLAVSKKETVLNDDFKTACDYKEMKEIVLEKLNFLKVGKETVPPVQVMSIQLQTLELAFKDGGLQEKYLQSWLRNTYAELEKLEGDAAPEGWLCQWDRLNKRYIYRNEQTGFTQWEYPEVQDSDIVGGAEAMDICNTPPPPDESVLLESVHKECNKSPETPPPPIISSIKKFPAKQNIEESAPSPPLLSVPENQPLPPGVDSPDLPYIANKSDTDSKDTLGSELDSFYSDIALLEATTNTNSKTSDDNEQHPSSNETNLLKKKKKHKSKVGQGTNIKSKAVSNLVEKWKKVQNEYM